jgi:GrpB-like predicted nucleotidyltransferase (UPF0157 family)
MRIPTRSDGPIHVAEPDPEWPRHFEIEAARIRSILSSTVVALDHVGSTSVPGLAAKPVIDLVLTVADSAVEESYVPQLEAAGFELRIREPDWHEHRLLKGPDRDINLHVFSAGEPEIERMLAFRDHLRADSNDRRLYKDTKRHLASQPWELVQDYADAKTEVIRSDR